MTKTEIKIKLRSLIKSGDFELVEQLLEGLNDVDYFKYSIHVMEDLSHKKLNYIYNSVIWGGKEHVDNLNEREKLKLFQHELKIKYNNMCAEAIETTESTGRE